MTQDANDQEAVDKTLPGVKQNPDSPMKEREFEELTAKLFALNNITPEMEEQWNQQYGSVGWTSFIIPGVDYAVVFVYRAIMRDEWKILRASLATVEDPDQSTETFCSSVLLWPTEATMVTYWATAPAFLPETIQELVMNASGAAPQTPPMRL
jgi:hypothetical protein